MYVCLQEGQKTMSRYIYHARSTCGKNFAPIDLGKTLSSGLISPALSRPKPNRVKNPTLFFSSLLFRIANVKKWSKINLFFFSFLENLFIYFSTNDSLFAQRYSPCRAFKLELNEVNDQAGQREVIAENLQANVLRELNLLVKDFKEDRKKHLQEGARLMTNLASQIGNLERARKAYDKAFREAEKALENYQRADADLNLSRAEVLFFIFLFFLSKFSQPRKFWRKTR